MRYQQISPAPDVARFVDCYWTLEGEGAGQRIVPDGRPEIIIHLGAPFESYDGINWKRQPTMFFNGQITGALMVRAAGSGRVVGIRFHPQGASCLLRMPMHELADRTATLDEIAPRLRLDHVADLPWGARLKAALDAVMRESAGNGVDERVGAAVDGIVRRGGLLSMTELSGLTGFSSRHIERRFRDVVGMPPKLFCRIQRFQRVFTAIEQGANWVDAALRCGYYDQAHLIRDFREFAAESPAALLGPETDLARHFLMSDFSKTRGGQRL